MADARNYVLVKDTDSVTLYRMSPGVQNACTGQDGAVPQYLRAIRLQGRVSQHIRNAKCLTEEGFPLFLLLANSPWLRTRATARRRDGDQTGSETPRVVRSVADSWRPCGVYVNRTKGKL
jgi:hypothetical protein